MPQAAAGVAGDQVTPSCTRMAVTAHGTSTITQVAGNQTNIGGDQLTCHIHLPPDPRIAVTRTLPGQVRAFTGRDRETSEIISALLATVERSVAVCAIDGMPGVGKTALAVRIGHLLAPRFPDRQLYVNLNAHVPGRAPDDPSTVLAGLLVGDGVDPRYVPESLTGRAGMWRDRMAGKRVLLILDDAVDGGQVTPLLPGSPGCVVVVTSRSSLGDLAAIALKVPLETLPPEDARRMFTALAPRGGDDSEGIDQLVGLVGHLPLAISLLAGLFNDHTSWTMADLISATRTELIAVPPAGDHGVSAAFHLSYKQLSVTRQRFFRLLGLHPGEDVEVSAAAALAGSSPERALAHLDGLRNDHLLVESGFRRFRMHDLIRGFSQALCRAGDRRDSDLAVERLLDFYHRGLVSADGLLTQVTPGFRRSVGLTDHPFPPDRKGALTWLAAERANLLACVEHARTHHNYVRSVDLSAGLAAFLVITGPWPQAIDLHTTSVHLSRQHGDLPAEARSLYHLGVVARLGDDYLTAAKAHQQALCLFRELGDRLGEANTLSSLGVMYRLTGDHRAAARAHQQALCLFRELGDRLGEANTLSNLGIFLQESGDHNSAVRSHEKALLLHRQLANAAGEARSLNNLGCILQAFGDYSSAMQLQEQSLQLCRDLGDRLGEANALSNLGYLQQVTGDFEAATGTHRQVLEICRHIGSRCGEAITLNDLADVHRRTGHYTEAARLVERSLVICRGIGDRQDEAVGLTRLGVVGYLTGDHSGAARMLREALSICRELGVRPDEAVALTHLGVVGYLTGDHDEAARMLREALSICRELGDRSAEAEAHNHLGAVHQAGGRVRLARSHHETALSIARELPSPLEEARALGGIGRCAQSEGDGEQAIVFRELALRIYQRLGVLEVIRQVEDQLGVSGGAASSTTPPVRRVRLLALGNLLGIARRSVRR